eukprot:scaffold17_cov354-Pavlova_lutheri.AAC.30
MHLRFAVDFHTHRHRAVHRLHVGLFHEDLLHLHASRACVSTSVFAVHAFPSLASTDVPRTYSQRDFSWSSSRCWQPRTVAIHASKSTAMAPRAKTNAMAIAMDRCDVRST